MTAQQICEEISKKVGPQLQELGVEAFVLVGYVKDNDGKVSKIQLFADGNNPAYPDGLRPMQAAAVRWGLGQL